MDFRSFPWPYHKLFKWFVSFINISIEYSWVLKWRCLAQFTAVLINNNASTVSPADIPVTGKLSQFKGFHTPRPFPPNANFSEFFFSVLISKECWFDHYFHFRWRDFLQFIIDGIFGDAHLSISMPIVSLMRVQSSRINRRQKANAAQGTIFISGFRKKDIIN